MCVFIYIYIYLWFGRYFLPLPQHDYVQDAITLALWKAFCLGAQKMLFFFFFNEILRNKFNPG